MAYSSERTYRDLLGSLDGSKNSVWAECLFVDPPGLKAFGENVGARQHQKIIWLVVMSIGFYVCG
jgi:hypothetical protein